MVVNLKSNGDLYADDLLLLTNIEKFLYRNDYIYAITINGDFIRYDEDTGETEILSSDVKSFVGINPYYFSRIYIIKNDKTLWGMGENNNGELGDGSKISRETFVKIANDVAYAGDYWYVLTDGSLYSWNRDNPKHIYSYAGIVWSNGEFFIDNKGTLYKNTTQNGEFYLTTSIYNNLFDRNTKTNLKVPNAEIFVH